VLARDAASAVAHAWNLGAVASSAQLLGAGRALLEASVRHVSVRAQFGQPVGTFQAVKHKLADVAIALEFARPLLDAAAAAITDGAATAPRDVSAAKVACADAATLAARAALQVHGAIGYTAEHDLSLWLTKVRALTPGWGTVLIRPQPASLTSGSVQVPTARGEVSVAFTRSGARFAAEVDVPATATAEVALPGVRAVRIYRGGLLDYNDRRIWVIAPPSEASPLVPPTQLVEGNVAQADAHLREGGWAVVSLALAEEHKLKIGQVFTLPTPNPTPFRVAAISTKAGRIEGASQRSATCGLTIGVRRDAATVIAAASTRVE